MVARVGDVRLRPRHHQLARPADRGQLVGRDLAGQHPPCALDDRGGPGHAHGRLLRRALPAGRLPGPTGHGAAQPEVHGPGPRSPGPLGPARGRPHRPVRFLGPHRTLRLCRRLPGGRVDRLWLRPVPRDSRGVRAAGRGGRRDPRVPDQDALGAAYPARPVRDGDRGGSRRGRQGQLRRRDPGCDHSVHRRRPPPAAHRGHHRRRPLLPARRHPVQPGVPPVGARASHAQHRPGRSRRTRHRQRR